MKPRPEAYNIAKIVESDKTAHRFIYLGDVYDDGTPDDYRERYEPVFGRLKWMTKPIPGNHDWHSRLSGYKNYWSTTPPYYWKVYGGWKVFFIDSNLDVRLGSAQYEYVKSRLQHWKGPVVACHHHHLYCAGGHGDQPQMGPIMSLFDNHYCVGLSGHTHNMQLFRQFGNYTQIVVGCGGRGQERLKSDNRLAWNNDNYGVLRMDFSPRSLDLAFVRHDGSILHETSLRPPVITML